uniref:hypothetical protein n=1 Tax=Petrachloros mirabilis TaxID=2918835 RepID=UPI001EE859CC|nr:hypothetical protein [Petrachloros mirabilis]
MVRRWVVNASPIISLTKIDRIHLLGELCDEVVIPQGVAYAILFRSRCAIATTKC